MEPKPLDLHLELALLLVEAGVALVGVVPAFAIPSAMWPSEVRTSWKPVTGSERRGSGVHGQAYDSTPRREGLAERLLPPLRAPTGRPLNAEGTVDRAGDSGASG